MVIHPILWPDIIIGFLIAETIFYTARATLHHLATTKRNHLVAQRAEQMRPAALDNYRAVQDKETHAPLG
jgi:hypothetical protein